MQENNSGCFFSEHRVHRQRTSDWGQDGEVIITKMLFRIFSCRNSKNRKLAKVDLTVTVLLIYRLPIVNKTEVLIMNTNSVLELGLIRVLIWTSFWSVNPVWSKDYVSQCLSVRLDDGMAGCMCGCVWSGKSVSTWLYATRLLQQLERPTSWHVQSVSLPRWRRRTSHLPTVAVRHYHCLHLQPSCQRYRQFTVTVLIIIIIIIIIITMGHFIFR